MRLRLILEPESGDPLRLLVDRHRLRFDGERWIEVENESTWTDREALVLGTVRIVGEDGSEVYRAEQWRTGDPRDYCNGEFFIIINDTGTPWDVKKARVVGSLRDKSGSSGRYICISGCQMLERFNRWPDGWRWIPYPDGSEVKL